MMEETGSLKRIIKKSEMRAESDFDYKKLAYHNERFLDCTIEEQPESLEITFGCEKYYPFTDIRKCTLQEKLRILLDVSELEKLRSEYIFSIKPDNLFYDDNARVSVMMRDVYQRGEITEEHFLEEYKALVGYSLQKKYGYDDYYEGGEDLYQKNELLKMLAPLGTLEEVIDLLEEEYQKLTKEIREKKILVNKKSYWWSRILIIISVLIMIAGATFIVYDNLFEKPRMEAKLQAEIDFIKGDYIQVIDDLSKVSMKHLGYDQKYILSVAYVNMESLTAEQKQNILEKIPINGDEKLMEYWIYIGRLDPVEAENIAMQKSDDELLLYAYMLDKDLTETDTTMTGEEKAAKLAELESKIEKLAEKYEKEEEQ
ncbi:MAG: type VII secretion protein EssB [Lachnospiraceae bacterium]|nr:type VII secretion protein EssB [Lachnospiraceae bacterium]